MSETLPPLDSITLQVAADNLDSRLISDETDYMQPVPVALGKALSGQPILETKNFPSPGSKLLDPQGVPEAFQYPGARPSEHFSLSGDSVLLGAFNPNAPVRVSAEASLGESPAFYVNAKDENGRETVSNIDDLLRSIEAATMGERIPVIAFGSNANPGQLLQKFKKLEGADKNVVPTLKARVKGLVPVYVARIGINGYVFTDLAPTTDPEAVSEVYLNFLSPAQLEAVNATEVAYNLCQTNDVELETSSESDSFKTPAYLYVGRSDAKGADVLTDSEGRPIRLAELDAKGEGLDQEFSSMTQQEVQAYIFDIAGENIARGLELKETPEDEVELAKIIINRAKDSRLEEFRRVAESADKPEPLGRLVARAIQQGIAKTGRIDAGKNVRTKIVPELQDIDLTAVKTFGELIGSGH